MNILNELRKSTNEEQLAISLKKIIKSFGLKEYRDIIYENNLFLSISRELKSEILSEIEISINMVNNEIDSIQLLIDSPDCVDRPNLKFLKSKCIFLREQLYNRKDDVNSL